jgi:hypothetical protein
MEAFPKVTMSMTQIFDIELLPETSNQDLSHLNRPKRMNLEQFESYPVTKQEAWLRKKIYQLEGAMMTLPDAKHGAELEAFMTPVHRFAPGVYTRELTIPPGQVVVGKRHAVEHQVLLIKGSCVCVTERGVEHMQAPMMFVSPAGEKRVVVTTDEEATWVTIHPTEHTDLDKIEADVIIAEPDRLAYYEEQKMKQINMRGSQ